MSAGLGVALFVAGSSAPFALRLWRLSALREQLKDWTGNFDADEVPEISAEKLAFYSQWTGHPADVDFILENWRALKRKFHTYRCIQGLSYLEPRVSRHKAYSAILERHRRASGGDFRVADFGCCFGQDVRKLVLDGVPAKSIVAVDLHDGYWRAGLELFRDQDEDGPPRRRLEGLATCFFDMSLPWGHADALETRPGPSAEAVFDVVILNAVLHTLSLAQHRAALARIRRLLKRGGMLVGVTAGSDPACDWLKTPDGSARRHLHSPASLRALLLELGFSSADVGVRDRSLLAAESAGQGGSGGGGGGGGGGGEGGGGGGDRGRGQEKRSGALAKVDALAELANRMLVEFTAYA